jgi:hypothetical protein
VLLLASALGSINVIQKLHLQGLAESPAQSTAEH